MASQQGGIGGVAVDPVIFSRKSTFHGPNYEKKDAPPPPQQSSLLAEESGEDEAETGNNENDSRPASSPMQHLVHQTNASGIQQTVAVENDEPEERPRPPRRSLFSALCCCFVVPANAHKPTQPTGAPNRANRRKLLGNVRREDTGKKCLVLDLDETLVHSSFKPTPNPDYIIPVHIEDTVHHVYVCKRPGVDEFLRVMGQHYEVVVYTASLNKYADPLLDQLDPNRVIRARLFRESCVCHEGNYVKDLSLLNRDLSQTIIVDNSPMSYIFHPENAIGCFSFIDDMADRELLAIQKFLLRNKDCADVRDQLPKYDPSDIHM